VSDVKELSAEEQAWVQPITKAVAHVMLAAAPNARLQIRLNPADLPGLSSFSAHRVVHSIAIPAGMIFVIDLDSTPPKVHRFSREES
jgi:hypothetical protein